MSGFKVFSTGQDLDAIFETSTGTDPSAQLVPFVTPAGQNLSERFLKYTSGTKASATGYKCFDINGNLVDLSDLYSKILQFRWSALGGGAQSSVYAIYAVDASNVYVGGNFTSVYSSGTTSVAGTVRIAKWDGNNWSALGGGAQGEVNAIYAVDASNVYVGGQFSTVYSSGTTSVAGTARIAKWDGNNWSPLDGGAQNYVSAISALDASNVYVGGAFTSVYSSGTTTVAGTARIAKWGYS